MDVQSLFYLFGIFFFVSWFLFLVSVAVFIIVSVRWMQKTQADLTTRFDELHVSIMDKLHQPATTVAASFLPLLPTIVAMIREAKRRRDR